MIRGRWILCAFSAAALAGAPLSAQDPMPLVPYLGGGLALGTSDLGQDTDSGWQVFGGVDVPIEAISVPGLFVGARAGYASIPYQGGFGEAMRVTTVTGELSYLIASDALDTVVPYLRAGAGLQVHRYEPGDLGLEPTTDSRAVAAAGAGVSIRLGTVSALLGGHFTTGTDAGFVTLGGALALTGIP